MKSVAGGTRTLKERFLHILPPPTRHRRKPLRRLFLIAFSVLLLTEVLGNGPALLLSVFAAQLQPPAKGVVNYQQFAKLGRDKQYHGPLKRDLTGSDVQQLAPGQKNPARPLPSAEPPTMQPLTVALSPALVTANASGDTVTQRGSDTRLEVQVAPGSVNTTSAKLANGATPATASGVGLTLQVTQRSGHSTGVSNVLGLYDVQVVDSQGHAVQGVTARKAISRIGRTARYH